MLRNILTLLLITSLLFCGCLESPYYQKSTTVPRNEWHYSFQPAFTFDVTDTTARYNLYFIIRHTEAYPYSNVWLKVKTKLPGDTVYQEQRVEIPLAENSGKWLGRGMGEIWEQRLVLGSNWVFKSAGTCEIRYEQNMRVNPLPEVLQVGLRVEKLGHTTNTPQ